MFDYITKDNKEFFAAIGWLTMAWAFIDNGLDFLSIAIHKSGGREIKSEAPWSLERKIKYLRRCFGRLSILEPYRERAFSILNRVKVASETRHDIIHGTISSASFDNNQVKMTRLLRGKTGRTVKPITLSVPKVYASANDALEIGEQLLTLATEVWDVLSPA